MNSDLEIKNNVRKKYSQIAEGKISSSSAMSSCCGTGSSCGSDDASIVRLALNYSEADLTAVPDGADLGLGCGTPATFAELKEGDTVLDLGSGAGIDVFIASRYVGKKGKAIGVDMTEAMIKRARENAQKVNSTNVEFRLGEIEALPIESNSVDRVISNCVINLVPSKKKAFEEIYRVLKPGGTFTVSDIVVDGPISDVERHDAALWAGCISGAIERKEYLATIQRSGFSNFHIVSEKENGHPLRSEARLFSITITGTK
jgi:arsenite methyltransferase